VKILDATTNFLSSKSFCHFGNFVLSKSRARQIKGSLKKPKPMPAVVIFINMAEVVNKDAASMGTRTAASTRRGFSFGNGAVGDKALQRR